MCVVEFFVSMGLCGLCVQSAVDGYHFAGDVCCGIRHEEAYQFCHFLRLAETLHRHLLLQLVYGQVLCHVAFDEAGGYGVYRDTAGCHFLR